MLTDAQLVAFVGSTDLQRAHRFYGDALGLRVVDISPYASVYDAHGTTLRVTLVEKVVAAPYTVVGWNVPDVAAAIAALTQKGVSFLRYDGMGQDDLGVWVAPSGHKVAWFTDPDGNTLSVSETPD